MSFERGKTNERVLQDLKKRSTIGIIFYLSLAMIGVASGGFYQRHPMLSAVFILLIVFICSFRLIHLKITRIMGERYAEINKMIFFTSVIITALIWGAAVAIITLLKDEQDAQLLMTVCLCGLTAGGVVAFIPHRWLSIFFNVAMLMPVIAAQLAVGSNMPLAAMIFLFSVYLSLMAGRGTDEYWNALENEHLLEIKSQELARLSNTDVLTGLYNRRYFDEMLDAEWKRSGRNKSLLSIVIFDLDYFKNINDTYGHQAGDEYLKKTSAVLASVFKRETDVVARFGGEEFIVLLPGMTADHVMQLAEKARQGIESMAVEYEGKDIRTTISAGVTSLVPDFNVGSDSVISIADQALYKAKQGGRNQVVFLRAWGRFGQDSADSTP